MPWQEALTYVLLKSDPFIHREGWWELHIQSDSKVLKCRFEYTADLLSLCGGTLHSYRHLDGLVLSLLHVNSPSLIHCRSSQAVAAVRETEETAWEKLNPLTRHDIAVKLHLTTSPQHCQQLAPEVGKSLPRKILLSGLHQGQERGSGWDLDQDFSQRRSWTLTQMIGLTFRGQSSQRRMGEDTPGGLQQPRGFKDRKVDGLQLYGLFQQLLIRWASFHGWHLINVPPVWRCCSGSWRQQGGDRRGSGSADGRHSKKQLSCHSQSLLAFTRIWNTLTVLAVKGAL